MDKTTRAEARQRFRERLREAREEAGLSQMEVARTLGHGQAFVSKIESVELEELAELYGKSLNYFRSLRTG